MTKPRDPRAIVEEMETRTQKEHDQRIRDSIASLPYNPFTSLPTARTPTELASLKAKHPNAIVYERYIERYIPTKPEIVVKERERVIYKRTLNFPLVLNLHRSPKSVEVSTTYGETISNARGVDKWVDKGEYLTVCIDGDVGVKYPTYEGPEVVPNAKIHLGLTTRQAQRLRKALDDALTHNVKALLDEAGGAKKR